MVRGFFSDQDGFISLPYEIIAGGCVSTLFLADICSQLNMITIFGVNWKSNEENNWDVWIALRTSCAAVMELLLDADS